MSERKVIIDETAVNVIASELCAMAGFDDASDPWKTRIFREVSLNMLNRVWREQNPDTTGDTNSHD